jgi:tRNA dimethylallyltransferase
VLRMFDGELDEPGAIAATQAATRRFVRRQRSWFGRDTRIGWLDAAADGLVAAARRQVDTAGRDFTA